jgi:hypothetical protein
VVVLDDRTVDVLAPAAVVTAEDPRVLLGEEANRPGG